MLIILLCTLTVLCPLIWKINGDSLFLGSALTRWDMLLNGEPPSLLKVKSYWRRHYRWNLCQCETDFSVCNLNLVLKLGLPCLLIFIKTSYTSGIIIYLVFFFEHFEWTRLYVWLMGEPWNSPCHQIISYQLCITN